MNKRMKEELSRFTEDTVNNVTKEIINYKNKDNLSWLQVYSKILIKLNLDKELNNNMLKIRVIREISKQGYDIITDPFNLEKYK